VFDYDVGNDHDGDNAADDPDEPYAGLQGYFIFIVYGLDVRLMLLLLMMMVKTTAMIMKRSMMIMIIMIIPLNIICPPPQACRAISSSPCTVWTCG
jgi:hypothetical protein